MTIDALPLIGATTKDPRKAAANAARIDAENKQGGKTYKVGQPIWVRITSDGPPIPSVVDAMHTGGLYGNLVGCKVNGEARRITVARITKRKVAE